MHKEWMVQAYKAGQATTGLTYEEIIYEDLVPEWIWDDHTASVFFESGRRGCDIPAMVMGWRYGDIPAGGRSKNYRDNVLEQGVSLMAIDGDVKIKTLTEAFISDRPVVRVSGYLVPYTTGSDGEPLVVCCQLSE